MLLFCNSLFSHYLCVQVYVVTFELNDSAAVSVFINCCLMKRLCNTLNVMMSSFLVTLEEQKQK